MLANSGENKLLRDTLQSIHTARAVATLRHKEGLASSFSDACINCITKQELQLSEF